MEKLDVMEKQMGKLDALEIIQKRLFGEEKRSWVNEGDTQPSEDNANTTNVVHRLFTHTQTPTTALQETKIDVPEKNDPLTRKIKIPLFDGENAEVWVQRVEQYFEMEEFSEEEKLKAVRMCFDGEALIWYCWERDRNPFSGWEQMKERVLDDFSVSDDLTEGERLLLLRQDDTTGVTAKNLSLWRQTLRRAGVKMFEPRNLKKMMSLSRKVEDWSGETSSEISSGSNNGTLTRSGGERLITRSSQHSSGGQRLNEGVISSTQKSNNTLDKHTTSSRQAVNPKPSQIITGEGRRFPYRRLTDSKANDRRAKGLCFRCDERFHAGHWCRMKELQVMVVSEELGDAECFYDVEEEAFDAVTGDVAECAVLSLGSAAGISSPRTMKLRGSIKTEEVTILIDSGASHNFISCHVVRRVGLMLRGTQEYGNWMGTGIVVHGIGVCQDVRLAIPGYNLEGEGLMVEYHELRKEDKEVACPNEFHQLLEEFKDVFEEPKGLPPSRGKEHSIKLKIDTKPVNVRPFRYPHAQKEEIEKQISNMLTARIMRESGSPFSSLVLLVKKKDGSWRFCVDYRALNKATIPDSYPIPMIDQLLDEFQGALIFSKLDLRPFLWKFVLVFFDDILIYRKSILEHQEHLKTVLRVLQQHQLFANHKKCQFGSQQVEYLGHVISADGVAADPNKIRAMTEWEEPSNIKR
ncbi:PREDICTED: uncharacterized protein LOC104773362 [Camelina sativa]|uniref:Uncharacterized protein LOC104773362 n=1 Tax=Camelina sativa TaxID=90675 RepID=A0ABM0Y6E6_CAMSA|nr:PREDICTED: uncharacterized protein LOC104773362 [Camelina sativa]